MKLFSKSQLPTSLTITSQSLVSNILGLQPPWREHLSLSFEIILFYDPPRQPPSINRWHVCCGCTMLTVLLNLASGKTMYHWSFWCQEEAWAGCIVHILLKYIRPFWGQNWQCRTCAYFFTKFDYPISDPSKTKLL